MTVNVLVSAAQMDRERAAEGFRAAQLSAVERGIHVSGRIPLGYRRGADRRLEPDADTAPVVQGVFEREAKGWSHEAVAGGCTRRASRLLVNGRPVGTREPRVPRRGARGREGRRGRVGGEGDSDRWDAATFVPTLGDEADVEEAELR